MEQIQQRDFCSNENSIYAEHQVGNGIKSIQDAHFRIIFLLLDLRFKQNNIQLGLWPPKRRSWLNVCKPGLEFVLHDNSYSCTV